jgi:hypothetical protein
MTMVIVGMAVIGGGLALGQGIMADKAAKGKAVSDISSLMQQQQMVVANSIQRNLEIKGAMAQKGREMRQRLTNVERQSLRDRADYVARRSNSGTHGANALYAYMQFAQDKMVQKGNIISQYGDGEQIMLGKQAQKGVNSSQDRMNQYQSNINKTASEGFRDRSLEIALGAIKGTVEGAVQGASVRTAMKE